LPNLDRMAGAIGAARCLSTPTRCWITYQTSTLRT